MRKQIKRMLCGVLSALMLIGGTVSFAANVEANAETEVQVSAKSAFLSKEAENDKTVVTLSLDGAVNINSMQIVFKADQKPDLRLASEFKQILFEEKTPIKPSGRTFTAILGRKDVLNQERAPVVSFVLPAGSEKLQILNLLVSGVDGTEMKEIDLTNRVLEGEIKDVFQSGSKLTFTATANNAVLMAARYVEGRMVEAKAVPVISGTEQSFELASGEGVIKLLLTDAITYAPLCPAEIVPIQY